MRSHGIGREGELVVLEERLFTRVLTDTPSDASQILRTNAWGFVGEKKVYKCQKDSRSHPMGPSLLNVDLQNEPLLRRHPIRTERHVRTLFVVAGTCRHTRISLECREDDKGHVNQSVPSWGARDANLVRQAVATNTRPALTLHQ